MTVASIKTQFSPRKYKHREIKTLPVLSKKIIVYVETEKLDEFQAV
jgi:hypothetical protein